VAETEGRRDFWSARENGGIPRLDPENFHHGRGEKGAVSPMQTFIVPILEISFTKFTCIHAIPEAFSKSTIYATPLAITQRRRARKGRC